ncbi:hypothetical protein V1503_07815 [Bacillus sp. SCS-151]|uniref:hypothetical protein n=1 Tax=Nanhaiella sioensis TaxID=3115293 RepID=UPI003979296B
MKKGTVFINRYVNHTGRENNTLAHECVHWFKHRPYFIHQSKKEDTFTTIAFRCPVKTIPDDKSNWSAMPSGWSGKQLELYQGYSCQE